MFKSLFKKRGKTVTTERQQILTMLSEGRLTVADAERLLDAVGQDSGKPESGPAEPPPGKSKPRFLRVRVSEGDGTKVNVRIPLQLLRSGVKLASLIPGGAQAKVEDQLRAKGISLNLNDLKPEAVEELIEGFSEMTIDVQDKGETVQVFCE